MSQMTQLTRRGALTGGAAAALAALGGTATASAASGPLPDPTLDTTHATQELAHLVIAYHQQKSARSVDGFMSFFSQRRLIYSDATWGGQWRNWPEYQTAVTDAMAKWAPTSHSYPTKIIGDIRSGVVLFTDSPQMFGHEIRVISAWDFQDKKIDRQVDYWDGRHFTIAAAQQMRVPAAQFPTEFGEDEIPERASDVLHQVTDALSSALSTGDAAAAAALFTSDATFEDLTLHTTMVGQQAIGDFLDRAATLLPYGQGTSVRHVVGTAQGGGYEWKNPGATVPYGIIALELDTHARITGLTTVWDGSLVTDPALTTMLQATIEH